MSLLKDNTIYKEGENLFYFFYKGTPALHTYQVDIDATPDRYTYFTFSTDGSSLRELADKKDPEMTTIIRSLLMGINTRTHNTKDDPYKISDEEYEKIKINRENEMKEKKMKSDAEQAERNKIIKEKEANELRVKNEEETILKDDDKYFREIQRRWQSIMNNGVYTLRKNDKGIITYESLGDYDSAGRAGEFEDFLKFLQRRSNLTNSGKINPKTNGYQVGLTVRRPVKDGKIGFCTANDFAVTDQQWQKKLADYKYAYWNRNSIGDKERVSYDSALTPGILKKRFNAEYPSLFDAIEKERKCMSTSDRFGKFLGIKPKSRPVEAVPVEVEAVPVPVEVEASPQVSAEALPEAVRVNAGGRKSRRHKTSKRNQKSKRSRKSKRRRHRKTRK
jgi:hypothetical protein